MKSGTRVTGPAGQTYRQTWSLASITRPALRHALLAAALVASIAASLLAATLAGQPVLANGLESLANGPSPAHKPLTRPRPLAQPRQGLRFENLSISDGLSQSTVRASLQDQQGFIWFGTEGGLNRYDGYEFTVYKHDPDDPTTLSHNQVNAIFKDRQGELWVGTNRGLDRFDRATETFTRYQHAPFEAERLSPGAVLSICEDHTGTLWVGTTGGLNRFDRASETFTRYQHRASDPTTLSSNTVWAITQDQHGDLWIGTNGGLDRFDRTTETFIHYRHDPDDRKSLSDNRVRAILEDRQGILWIGTDGGGLNRLDPSSGAFTSYQQAPDSAPGPEPYLSGDRVTALWEDSSGRLWVGTQRGLDLLDWDRSSFIHCQHDPSDATSLSNDLVWSLYEDRSGVLWVGTHSGLSKHSRTAEQFELYQQDTNLPNTLSDNLVQAVCQDLRGFLWIGTFAGGLIQLDRLAGRYTIYQHDPDDPTSLSSNDVRAILEDQAGVLWIGTDMGLDRFDPQTERFTHHSSLGRIRVTALAEDRSGDLWVGTSAGLYRFDRAAGDSGMFRPYDLGGSYVLTIYQGQDGLVWVGTYGGGAYLWDGFGNQFSRYPHDPDDPQSLSGDVVLSFYHGLASGEGTTWIGTEEGGLNRFDRATQTFTHYTEKDGLPGDTVGCILADFDGYLWLSTNRGLSRLNPQTGAFHNYDGRDGLQTGEFVPGACFRSHLGEMFFGGYQGLNAFYPEKIELNSHSPPIVVTALDKFGQVIRPDRSNSGPVQLSYRDNDISFEFAALDFTAPEKNQYAYMMEGLDQEWVYAGTRRHADYPDLRPGDYLFRVKGSNNDGVWNETGSAVHITVTPPWWEAWWFRGIVALVLLGGVLGGYSLRVRSVEARSRRLESQVRERTYQLEALYRQTEALYRQMEALYRQMEALYRADEELYRHLDLDQVLQALVDTAVDLLQADKSAVMVWDEGRERLVIKAARGFDPEATAQLSSDWKEAAGRVTASGEPIIVEDTAAALPPASDPRWQGGPPPGLPYPQLNWGGIPMLSRGHAESAPAALAQGIRSFMHLPVTVGGEPFGLFNVSFSEPHAFDPDRQRLFQALAQRASLAIENAQLYEQAQALAAVEERQRLARDLHDAVSQTLFSTSLIAEVLPRIWERDPEDGQRRLEQVRQATRSALAEMRTLLLELRPAGLVETDLGDLLRQLAEALTGRARVMVSVEVEGVCPLPPAVHVAFFRIAQEALNNVVKHARANQATVRLCRQEADQATLSIRDDGRGFEPDGVPPGCLGIGIMRERAEAVGARLDIASQSGQGTEVTVVWAAGEPG